MLLKLWRVGPHLKIFPTRPPGKVMDVLMLRYDAHCAKSCMGYKANVLIYLQPRDIARLASTGHQAHRIVLHFVEICLEEEDRGLET